MTCSLNGTHFMVCWLSYYEAGEFTMALWKGLGGCFWLQGLRIGSEGGVGVRSLFQFNCYTPPKNGLQYNSLTGSQHEPIAIGSAAVPRSLRSITRNGVATGDDPCATLDIKLSGTASYPSTSCHVRSSMALRPPCRRRLDPHPYAYYET